MELRTVRIEITNYLAEESKERLKETMLQCQRVFEFFAKLGGKHKSVSYMNLHKFGYAEIIAEFPDLPTTYIQSTAKQALACLDAYNTQQRKLATKYYRKAYYWREHKDIKKAEKYEEKRKKYEDNLWNYKGIKTSLSLCLNKTSLSRRGNLTTFSCIGKRIRILHDIPKYFSEKYNTDQKNLQSGFVVYDEKAAKFSLLLSFKVEQKKTDGTEIIGIDRGIYNLATLSDGTIFNSKKHYKVKRKYQYLRSKLQQKGTRSAKRLLKKRSKRERRFMRDVNHCITKQLASRKNVSTYVLENLKNIRSNNEEKAKNYEKGKKKKNRWLSNWSFFEFQTFLEYKCWDHGIRVAYVDPRYTSQKCSNCGKVEKTNRQGSRYRCSCGYSANADINAARNIRLNYLNMLTSAASESGSQAAVNQPYVSGVSVANLLLVTRD